MNKLQRYWIDGGLCEIEPRGVFAECVHRIYLQDEADAVISALEDELAIYEAVFDANWEADQRAIKQWQAETGEVKVWPDRCDMVVWLLNKHDKEKAAWEAKEKALQDLALHLEALSDEMNERHPKDYVGLRLAYEYSANKLREILNREQEKP